MIKPMNEFKSFPKPVAVFFVLIGLTSALFFRLIIIIQHFRPSGVRVFWYVAVITNLIFFMFRYHIACKRKRAIYTTGLIPKLSNTAPLDQSDKKVLLYLVTSIERSWENLNYLGIAILSAVAIITDILLSARP